LSSTLASKNLGTFEFESKNKATPTTLHQQLDQKQFAFGHKNNSPSGTKTTRLHWHKNNSTKNNSHTLVNGVIIRLVLAFGRAVSIKSRPKVLPTLKKIKMVGGGELPPLASHTRIVIVISWGFFKGRRLLRALLNWFAHLA
jgi:hypothetical protein